ncbi:MAG: hypothetical protein AABY75_05485 [Bacteroidota bacterium]
MPGQAPGGVGPQQQFMLGQLANKRMQFSGGGGPEDPQQQQNAEIGRQASPPEQPGMLSGVPMGAMGPQAMAGMPGRGPQMPPGAMPQQPPAGPPPPSPMGGMGPRPGMPPMGAGSPPGGPPMPGPGMPPPGGAGGPPMGGMPPMGAGGPPPGMPPMANAGSGQSGMMQGNRMDRFSMGQKPGPQTPGLQQLAQRRMQMPPGMSPGRPGSVGR